MPNPLDITDDSTGKRLWSCDFSGNTDQIGNALVRGNLSVTGTTTSTGAQTFNGNVTVAGNLAVTGTTALTGKETINGSSSSGLLAITNAVQAGGGTIQMLEAASSNAAYGSAVSGDSNTRFAANADGQLNWGSGSAGADTVMTRTGAGLLSVTTGSMTVNTAGQGFRAKEGTNAKQGTAILSSGAATVANTSVTANSRIFLTSQVDGGTPGFVRVSTRSAGTSFTITSSSGTDTSTIAYEIFEPA